MKTALALVLLALIAAAGLRAEGGRGPEEADRLYHEVGDQLFCICGCREKLLTCSHNICESKTAERRYLRELAQDARNDAAAIKQAMVKRFGPQVLQVPEDSAIYTVLAIALAALATAFGGMFWYVAGRRRAQAEQAPAPAPVPGNVELEQRIERDLQELE